MKKNIDDKKITCQVSSLFEKKRRNKCKIYKKEYLKLIYKKNKK